MNERVLWEPRGEKNPLKGRHGSDREEPRLTFIMAARNDGYMVNFNWRLETTLNYLAQSLERLGRLAQVEVVISDWGSEVPLHAVLSLNRSAQRLVRFILVPPETARRAQGDSEFPIVLAQNAAVRRSRGEYIAQTDSDIIFPSRILGGLFSLLEGRRLIDIPVDRALLVSRRRQIPWKFANGCPSLRDLEWLTDRVGKLLPLDPMFPAGRLELYTASGFVLMHRSLWQECRGYDERLLYWGWMDVDLALRVTTKYPWIFLDRLGIPPVYHLEHYHPESNRQTTRKSNRQELNSPIYVNADGWGMANQELKEFAFGEASDAGVSLRGISVNSGRVWDLRQRLTAAAPVILAAFARGTGYGFPSRSGRACAKYLSKLGQKALRQGRFQEARRHFASAFRYQPFYGKNLGRWILSLLPGLRDWYVAKKAERMRIP